jgi:hypothetical protein
MNGPIEGRRRLPASIVMLVCWPVLLVGAADRATAQAAPPPRGTLCDLIQTADVVSLFGRPTDARINPVNGDCTWGSTVGIARRGLTLSVSPRDTATANDGYARGRELAANNQTITDERGLGDRAYSAVVPYGATITVLTRGRIVQFRYSDGVAGSQADLDRLRLVAASAIGRLSMNGDAAVNGTAPPQ